MGGGHDLSGEMMIEGGGFEGWRRGRRGFADEGGGEGFKRGEGLLKGFGWWSRGDDDKSGGEGF